jgi:tRNA pseudouridine55 synthase
VDGERAYNLARQGSDMQLAPKQITIEKIELLSFAPPQATIRVVCGKGTYIRSLARDIGEALGSGAYLTRLTRTRVGDYRIEECIHPDDFAEWLDKQLSENINP